MTRGVYDRTRPSTLIALRESIAAHPDWYAAQHARAIGCSRQRISQLVVEHEIRLPKVRGRSWRHAREDRMNSQDERRIFEQHGWRLDSVQRAWLAPDGAVQPIDDIVIAADALGRGPRFEALVRRVALEHGIAPA